VGAAGQAGEFPRHWPLAVTVPEEVRRVRSALLSQFCEFSRFLFDHDEVTTTPG